jgi:CDP-glucose 4,6-dehydratase
MNFDFWKNRNVFLTGHTGFKGGWMAIWLLKMGAKVYGYSLSPPTIPSFFTTTKLEKYLTKSVIANILDLKKLLQEMEEAKPSIVIHMAAQSLVRESYNKPLETFMTNVIGTANVLEITRKIKTVKAIINVTSDKCYENQERILPYNENDILGGNDPYSSSKACAELVTNSYRKSFFKDSNIRIASVRSGNVIGGGDWAIDRLVPDFFRALNSGSTLRIRYPNAIRPWQHVLEPLSGYLKLAEKLLIKGDKYVGAWNFGSKKTESKPVSWVVEYLCSKVPDVSWKIEKKNLLNESELLNLNSSKSITSLGWRNYWKLKTALNKTIEWYQAWNNKKEDMMKFTKNQISAYELSMK